MAMILQCVGSNGRPLPYFIIGPDPRVVPVAHTSVSLMSDYHYPHSNHCSGLSIPWPGYAMQLVPAIQGGQVVYVAQAVPRQSGHATAVAPMIPLDLPGQLVQDVRTQSFTMLLEALGLF